MGETRTGLVKGEQSLGSLTFLPPRCRGEPAKSGHHRSPKNVLELMPPSEHPALRPSLWRVCT